MGVAEDDILRLLENGGDEDSMNAFPRLVVTEQQDDYRHVEFRPPTRNPRRRLRTQRPHFDVAAQIRVGADDKGQYAFWHAPPVGMSVKTHSEKNRAFSHCAWILEEDAEVRGRVIGRDTS